MPLSVSFQKMDPMLDAIIIGAKPVCVPAPIILACRRQMEEWLGIYVAHTSAPEILAPREPPVHHAYLSAKIYGAEVSAYK
jgi:hypothetical protein